MPSRLRLLFVLLALGGAAAASPATGAPRNPEDPATYRDILDRWPPPLRDATLTLSNSHRDQWAWIFREVSRDENLVQRWDPTQPEERRTLLLERDGQKVSEEEALAHGKKMAEERSGRSGPRDPARAERRTRAWLETVRAEPVEETATTVTYRLWHEPPEHGFDDFPIRDRIRNRTLVGLSGRVTVNKSPAGFLRLELTNPKVIRPYFSVRIEKMDVVLENAPVRPGGPFLPTVVRGAIKGHFLLVGSIDRTWAFSFWDYRWVGGPREAPVAATAPVAAGPSTAVR